MNTMWSRIAIAGLLAGLAAASRADSVRLDERSPSRSRESLIWTVDREITGFRVDVLDGNPIINTVRFLGRDEEFHVGAYFSKGQNVERRLSRPVRVGQLRVNVDRAQGSRLRLTIYTSGGGRGSSGRSDSAALRRPTQRQQSLIWDVNQEIRGFEVIVREGRPIINTVRILGGEEFRVGSYMEPGQRYRRDFPSRVRVGQLRVNVDQALGSAIELRTWR